MARRNSWHPKICVRDRDPRGKALPLGDYWKHQIGSKSIEALLSALSVKLDGKKATVSSTSWIH